MGYYMPALPPSHPDYASRLLAQKESSCLIYNLGDTYEALGSMQASRDLLQDAIALLSRWPVDSNVFSASINLNSGEICGIL
jgi:hypothetical protein